MSGMADDPRNIIICGVGGQGNILVSRLMGRILHRAGRFVTIGETFGAAQRGGAVHSSLRISESRYYGPLVPAHRAHVVLGLEPLETLRALVAYGNPHVVTVTNTRPVYPVGVLSRRLVYPAEDRLREAIESLSRASWFLDATASAMRLNAPIAANMVMLGALSGTGAVAGLSIEAVEEEIRETFPPAQVELNLQALDLGVQALAESASTV